jgi:hypothetical protein
MKSSQIKQVKRPVCPEDPRLNVAVLIGQVRSECCKVVDSDSGGLYEELCLCLIGHPLERKQVALYSAQLLRITGALPHATKTLVISG